MKMMTTSFCGIEFDNPVTVASGPGGNGEELSEHIDLQRLGAFTSKTVTKNPLDGNPPPRIVDVYGGIINSIGLQNNGFKDYKEKTLPFLEKTGTPIITSIASNYLDELIWMINGLNDTRISIIEINLSCPNIDKKREMIGEKPENIYHAVKKIKSISKKPVLIKFGPDTNLMEMIEAVVISKADGVVLINCPKGTKIDINTGKPVLKRVHGGLAGPAIKPIALHHVYTVRKKFPELNILGTGGILNHEDALEYLMAGADMVGIGFGVMMDPETPLNVIKGLKKYLKENETTVEKIKGMAQIKKN